MKPTINNRETRTKRETRRSEDADSNCDSLCDCVRMKTRLSGGRSQRSVFDELRSQSGAGPPAHRGGSAVRQDARQEDPHRPPPPPSAPARSAELKTDQIPPETTPPTSWKLDDDSGISDSGLGLKPKRKLEK